MNAITESKEGFLFMLEGARHFVTIAAMITVVYYLMF